MKDILDEARNVKVSTFLIRCGTPRCDEDIENVRLMQFCGTSIFWLVILFFRILWPVPDNQCVTASLGAPPDYKEACIILSDKISGS
jgi:hypothetical protein